MNIFFYKKVKEFDLLMKKMGFLKSHLMYYNDILNYLYQYKVNDIGEADYAFIPFNLIFLQFSESEFYRKKFFSPNIYERLVSLPYLDMKQHILVSTGDFGQRSNSWYYSQSAHRAYPFPYNWLDENFSLIVLESTTSLFRLDIGFLPYPLTFNGRKISLSRKILLSNIGLKYIDRIKKDFLYNFIGTLVYNDLHHNHIRGGILKQIASMGDDYFIGTEAIYKRKYKRKYKEIVPVEIELINRSIFTLCPAGYGRWTFRLGLALVLGSIPVIIADDYVLPFRNKIPWDKLVIKLPENQVFNIDKILRSISPLQIEDMRNEIYKHRNFFKRDGVLSLIASELEDQIN